MYNQEKASSSLLKVSQLEHLCYSKALLILTTQYVVCTIRVESTGKLLLLVVPAWVHEGNIVLFIFRLSTLGFS